MAKKKKKRQVQRQDVFTLSVILAVVTLVLYAQVSVFEFIKIFESMKIQEANCTPANFFLRLGRKVFLAPELFHKMLAYALVKCEGLDFP